MSSCRTSRLTVIWFAFFAVAIVHAQEAPPAAVGAQQAPPSSSMPAPQNLKALPRSLTAEQVIRLMREYTGDLGVECEYCHAQNPQTKRLNFASDANPMKDTARYMITMTSDLNDKYLENLPGRRYGDPVTCGTCHQGHSHPQVFVPAPRRGPGGPPPPGPSSQPAPPATR